jgi:alpha-L-rhamnosidase
MFMLMFLTPSTPQTAPAAVKATYLRCEYLTDPVAVDAPHPRLSWELQPVNRSVRGAHQTAYRIRAASSRRLLVADSPDLWDSGKVTGDATAHIPYGGKPPAPSQQVFWQVKVWDQADRESDWSPIAHWTRGLPSEAWSAQWIGDPASYPEPVKAHNGYHTELTDRAEVTKWVQIDLGTSRTVDAVRLWPAKPYDWQPATPGFLFPLRFRIETALAADGPFAVVYDATGADQPLPAEAVECRFGPVQARFVRLTVTRLRQRDPGHFGMALAEMEVLHNGVVVSKDKAVQALDSIENGPWAMANLTDGDTVSHPAGGAEPLPPILLRREFSLDRKPGRAVLFASALGVYEVRINGVRVGDHILAPEWTDYGVRVQYQGYDVTALLRKGANTIAATVGDGWYAGRIGLFPGRGHYGRRPEFRAELHADGVGVLMTDGSWKLSTDGPIRHSDILDGEVYDARKEMPGWDGNGYDDSAWPQAAVCERPSVRMVAQPNEPIRVTRELPAINLTQPAPGVWIFDLGQNMVGWVRLRLRAPAGTTVHLRHGEMLNEDGTLYTDNLRGAPQGDFYVCRGHGMETFEPHFTYHGFRYIEVTGLPSAPSVHGLVGRVFHSSSPEVGTFTCSDPGLNRLWQNIVWTQRANLMSTPTDCPQRDERLGWMGDIQAFGPTACHSMDLAAFFTKWLADVRDAQAADGRFPDFAPNPGDSNKRFSGVPAWGDAGVILPWLAYTTYGDLALLRESHASCRRWIEYIHGQNPNLIWEKGRHNDYNDWLNGDTLIAEGWPTKGGEVPHEVFATAFWANSTRIVAQMAEVLGLQDDAERYRTLHRDIRNAFIQRFVQADGSIHGNTQAGYALALHFDLVPDELRPKVVEKLIAAIEAYGWRISTGIQSTHRMMLELTRAGRTDIAYRLMMYRGFPSWLYSVDNGATTIWERWDGYVKGRGFQNPGMNSFNHWALGAVGEWMVKTIVGLRPQPDAVGWNRFVVAPEPGGGLTSADASYRALPGMISVAWRIREGRFELDVTVPPNASATVRLPCAVAEGVREGNRAIGAAPGVRMVGVQDGRLTVEVTSGSYRFVCPAAP